MASNGKTGSRRWLGKLPLIAIIVQVIFVFTALGWYANRAFLQRSEHLEVDTRRFATLVRAQIDTVYVRIKDVFAFVATGQELAIARKLQFASRQSQYIYNFGYLTTDRPEIVQTLIGENVLKEDYQEAFRPLLDQLTRVSGLTYAVRPAAFPGVFATQDQNHVIFMQAMPQALPQTGHIIVFAEVDLRLIMWDVSDSLTHTYLSEARYFIQDEMVEYEFPGENNLGFEAIVDPNKKTVLVDLSRNLSVSANLVERTGDVNALIVMLGIFLIIGASVTGSTLIYARMRGKSERALRHALASAEQASSVKSEFLANMSHEIRTPLNGILGMAELMIRGEMLEKNRRYIEQIQSSGNTLLALLNDILDLSKLEQGQLAIDPVRTNLANLLHEITSFYAPTAQNKNLALLMEVAPDLPAVVMVDPTRLRQVIGNLISNALKFTSEGEVVLSAKWRISDEGSSKGMFEFSVSDTGIGISQENAGKLFARFQQAEQSTTRQFGGTGLGLAICKDIVEQMGGNVTLESVEGEGSTFTIFVPLDVEESARMEMPLRYRVAVVSHSPTLKRILESSLGQQGISYELFPFTDDLHASIKAAHQMRGPLHGVIIDEGSDMHRAREIRASLLADPATRNLWCMVLGDRQINKSYDAFDGAVIKPFLPETLTGTILRLSTEKEGQATVDAGAAPTTPAPVVVPQPALTQPALTQAAPPPPPASPQGVVAASSLPSLLNGPIFAGRSCLLTDDNYVNIIFAEEAFEELGFRVVTASNGEKAVAAAMAEPFDIIFMDCRMPVMDGYEATGILRQKMANGEIPETPIVAVTANAMKGDKEKCLDAGMHSFLSKPLKIAELIDVLDQFLPRTPPEAAVAPTMQSAAPPMPAAVMPAAAEPVAAAPVAAVHPAPVAPQPAPPQQVSEQVAPPAPPSPVQAAPAPAPQNVQPVVAAPAPQAPAPRPPAPAPVARSEPAAAPQAPAAAPAAPSKAEAPRIPIIDVAAFNQTRSAVKRFDTLLSFYRTDTAEYIKTIREAFAQGQLADAVTPAHTIKSSSKTIGATGLARLAEFLEVQCRSGDETRLATLNEARLKLEQVFKLTEKRIDEILAEDDGGVSRISEVA